VFIEKQKKQESNPTIAGENWSSEANKDCSESNQSNRYGCFEKGGDTAVTRETANNWRGKHNSLSRGAGADPP
jgi:hypothetical protein